MPSKVHKIDDVLTWIHLVKSKAKKRKRKSKKDNLRVLAILSTSLNQAEVYLQEAERLAQIRRHKQIEREMKILEQIAKQQQEMSSMWNTEINELDEFFKKI